MSSPPPKSTHGTKALGAGLTLAVSTALLACGGMWLDERFGTKPLCTVLGALWGFLGGTVHLLRVLAPELLPFSKRRVAQPKSRDDAIDPPSSP